MLTLKKNKWLALFGLASAAILCTSATAQSTPGEDPILLQNRVTFQWLPSAPPPKSSSLNFLTDMPAWQQARISRYEAKAYSPNVGDLLTEKDVVNTVNTDGFKTTCTQTIGSTTASTGAGVKPTQQIVVLRGDLVNICN